MTVRTTARLAGRVTVLSAKGARNLAGDTFRARTSARVAAAAKHVEATDYDPVLPAAVADPYPFYRRLLRGGPVHYNAARCIWVVSRYEDVRAGLRADDVLSSAQSVLRYRFPLPMMIMTDQPDHTRLRRLVAKDFSRGAIDGWQPVINELADGMVDAMVRAGGGEVVESLAMPLPVELIARMLGIPSADKHDFHRWSNQAVRALEIGPSVRSLRPYTSSVRSALRLRGYFHRQLERRRTELGNDLLSKLLASTAEDRLTDEELYWFAMLLLLAGNETTTNLLSALFLTLAQHPDQYALLRDNPELIGSAIEEQLRYISPIQGLFRGALRDYQVEDQVIPAGSRVLMLYAAANRDPRHYPDPDTFRVDRNPTDHLAFGAGIHYCLGAYLSKLEARRVLQRLLPQVERIELAGDYTWRANPSLRGLTRLPVRLIAR